MRVEDDRIVKITYELSDEEGETLEAVGEDEALPYLHGHDNIIDGLEEELDGLETGDTYSAKVPPEQAYGERMEELVSEVDRAKFPDDVELEPGMIFEVSAEQAQEEGSQFLMVRKVDGDKVEVDANHPLAGDTLHYEGQIFEVREATDEELAAGRPLEEQ